MSVRGPLNVIWLLDSLTLGGAERLTVDFARHADRKRVQVQVVTLRSATQLSSARAAPSLEPELIDGGVPVYSVEIRNLRDFAAFQRLRRHVRECRPHLIHAHLRYASIWAGLAGRLEGIPALSTVHVLPGNTSAGDAERRLNPWQQASAGLRDAALTQTELYALNHWLTRVIAVSNSQGNSWLEAGINPSKLTVIPNGVQAIDSLTPVERNQRRAAINASPETFVFITVAVVRRPKGWQTLLEAVPRILQFHPATRFLWIGDGPDMPALSAAVSERGLGDHICLLGQRTDVARWLPAGDAFLFPSYEESLPTAVIEAMAAGLPIVGSDIPPVREVVKDCAVCVPSRDSVRLAEAACRLVVSSELRLDCSLRGKQRYLDNYSSAAWRNRLLDFYDEVLETQERKLRVSVPRRPVMTTPNAAAWPSERPADRLKPVLRQRILAVEFFSVGGLFHYTAQLCSAMARAGAQVTLLSGRNPEFVAEDAQHSNGLELLPVLRTWNPRQTITRWLRKPERYLHGALYIAAWIHILAVVRRLNPDVVLFGDLEHRCDAYFIRKLQRRGFRVVDIWHNVDAFERTSRDDTKLVRRESWRDELARNIDVIFVHGETLATELRERTGKQAVVIPHGDESLMLRRAGPDPDIDRKLSLPPGAVVALLFGTITKYKGVPLLIDALARIPEASRPIVVIAGFPTDDTHTGVLKAQVTAAGLAPWVRWDLRYVPLEEVAWFFRRADFVVLPYRAASQSGVAHLALTFAKPLIVTAVGALPEATGGGRAGIIVPPSDPAALAAAIQRLTNQCELRVSMAAEAGRMAAERGNWDAIANRVMDALAEQLKEIRTVCAVSADTSAAA